MLWLVWLLLAGRSAVAAQPALRATPAQQQCKVSVAPATAAKPAVRTVKLSSGCSVYSNGCSGPVDALPYSSELTPACHAHDWCYSCGWLVLPLTSAGRLACDQRFRANLHAICEETFGSKVSSSTAGSGELQSCRSTADLMYAAVRGFQADKPLTRADACRGESVKLAAAPFGLDIQYSAGDAVVQTLAVSNGGRWGAWQELAACAAGSFVAGLSTKVQPDAGFFGDDTGLNSIAASCSTKAGSQTDASIKSFEGRAGSWSDMQHCPAGTHAVSFRLRVQPAQGRMRDDVAADAVELVCSDKQRTVLGTPNALGVGQWSEWQACKGSAICSFRIKYEQDGALDDTAMNDLEAGCCRL